MMLRRQPRFLRLIRSNMTTPRTSSHTDPDSGPNRLRQLVRSLLLCASAICLAATGLQAANVLNNPGMESGTTSWTAYDSQPGWDSYAIGTAPLVHSGNNSFKVYAGWNSDPNYQGQYQDYGAGAGAVFNGTAWFFTPSSDLLVGTYGGGSSPDSGNTVWVEVTFRDAASNVLGLYRSGVFDSSYGADTWVELPITNQCDPATGQVTNMVTTFTAPAGTTFARYQVVLKQSGNVGAGAAFIDDMVLDQISGPTPPVFSAVKPGNILLANAADGLSFTVSGSSTIANGGIHLTVNGSNVSSGLVITGSAAVKNVSWAGLKSNQTYTASIQVTDANGLSSSSVMTFDTWAPVFVWEGEDFDHSGGLYLNNPAQGAYANLVGAEEIDYHDTAGDGDHLYRVGGDRMATTPSGDVTRQKYVDAGATDYKIGWFGGGEWVNYTRSYPAGVYNVYARMAGNAGAATLTLDRVTSGWGTSEQSLANLGTFAFPGTGGWSTYIYQPLTDTNGNLVPVSLSGTNTLRITTGGGGDVSFVMLVPANTNKPAISGVYPNGATLMQGTNKLVFHVGAASSTIDASGIQVVLNGTNVSSSLQITGTASAKDVVYSGLVANTPVYTAVLTVTDVLGNSSTKTVTFDTFSPANFTWESEDYDFDGGSHVDNPVLTSQWVADGYYGQAGVEGVDFHETTGAGDHIYRPSDTFATPIATDVPRQSHLAAQAIDPLILDYKIGWFDAGEWANHTRTYPKGNFNVYARLAGGNPGTVTLTLSKVTAGSGTTEQTTSDLGTFSFVGRGWQTYDWVPLKNGDQMTTVTLDGLTTLRITTGGGIDPNFLMLVPASVSTSMTIQKSGANVSISFPTLNGSSYGLKYKTSLGDAAWQPLSTVTGDGATKTVTDPASGLQRFYRIEIQ
jgi:hypothetical protein